MTPPDLVAPLPASCPSGVPTPPAQVVGVSGGRLGWARPCARVEVVSGVAPRQERSSVAQLAEHATVNRRVTGSSPVGGASTSGIVPVSDLLNHGTPG